MSPDGTKVYVGNLTGASISVISTTNDFVTRTISVGAYPYPVLFAPNGRKAYVVNGTSSSVSVIDVGTDSETKKIPVGAGPYDIGIIPDGTKAYVANFGFPATAGTTLSVIDLISDTVSKTISISGFNPSRVTWNPSGTKAYVSHVGSPSVLGDISVVDASDTVTKSFGVGNKPGAITFTLDGTKAYVANGTSATVSVINTTTDSVLSSIPVGDQPTSIVVIRPTQ